MTLLAAAWLLQKTFGVAGLTGALAGVAVFGWHFIRISALVAQGDTDEISPESWRGSGARLGLSILACGVALAVASMVLANVLPSRY
jgi:hypothetical protein